MSLRTILSNYGFAFQRELFPALEEELGPLGERYELFVTVLGFVQVEQFLTCLRGLPGRPQEDRAALARAFIAKAVFAITTTRGLVERLAIDPPLRRLCGWSRAEEVPSEATFSRCQRHGEMSRFRQDKMSHFLHVKRLQPGWLPRSSLAVLLLHRDTEHPRLALGLEPVALALDVDRCRVV